jgi:hypothetical protein
MRYEYFVTQIGPVGSDQEALRLWQIEAIQAKGVCLQLGPLDLRSHSWAFIVTALNSLYRGTTDEGLVTCFAEKFNMPAEKAREAVSAFLGTEV